MHSLQDLRYWTVSRLQALPAQELDILARRGIAQLTRHRLFMGRCLLAMERNGTTWSLGYSGIIAYSSWEGIDSRDALDWRRVALCLESLPLLREAAEEGRPGMGWSKLREITHKATPATEERWLELALRKNYKDIEDLVSATGYGEMPSEHAPSQSKGHELRFRLDADEMQNFLEIVRYYSLLEGRSLTYAEVHRRMLTDHRKARRGETLYRPIQPDEPVAAPARPWSPVGAAQLELLEELRSAEAPSGRTVTSEPSQPRRKAATGSPGANDQPGNPRLRYSGTSRAATSAQRRELLRREAHCCANPGCPNNLWLDVHHVVFYYRGGATLPENLVVVCTRCHRNLHRGWLRVMGTAPDGLIWTDRRGIRLDRPRPGPPQREEDVA